MSEECKDAICIVLVLIFGATFIALCASAICEVAQDRAARRCAEYGYGVDCSAYKQAIERGEAE